MNLHKTPALILAAVVVLCGNPAASASGPDQKMERDTVGGRFQIVQRSDDDSYDIMLNGRVLENSLDRWVSIIASYRGLNDPPSAKDRLMVVEYVFGGTACSGHLRVFAVAPTGEVSISEPIADCIREDLDKIERLGDNTLAFIYDADVYHAPDIYIYDHGSISEPVTVAPMQRSIDTTAGRLYMRARSGAIDLLLKGNPLTAIDGESLYLVGAHPADAPRLAVFAVERAGPPHCSYEWRVAKFTEAGGARFSEPFAECRDDPNIVFPPKGGVLIGFEAWADEPAMVFRYRYGSLKQIR